MPQRTEETALRIKVQVIQEHVMVASTVKPADDAMGLSGEDICSLQVAS